MRIARHVMELEPCPYLPLVEEAMTAVAMKRFGRDRGPEFYVGALRCAQSLWRQGLPAQAILQLNRALSADLQGGEAEVVHWPLPYAAMVWIMGHRVEDQFLGNPRRHFQHLATRMVEPRRELRSWRAWACWHLSRVMFPDDPADERQLREEGIVEPGFEEIRERLAHHGHPGETLLWESACRLGEGLSRRRLLG